MRPHLELTGLISSSICAFEGRLERNEGGSFSHPIGITDVVLGVHGGAADVVRRTSWWLSCISIDMMRGGSNAFDERHIAVAEGRVAGRPEWMLG